MKFLTYSFNGVQLLGCIINQSSIVNISKASNKALPNNLNDYLRDFQSNNISLKKIINSNSIDVTNLNDVNIETLIQPNSFRDFYAFRQHVQAGRRSRGLDMIPEYDEFPVFYFSNHQSICGPGYIYIEDQHLKKLDFEFEIAAVICKKGKNIKFNDANDYIGGFVILNDWSEREIQLKEMKLNLGPAKGKDFATSIGPYLVTLDELEDKKIEKADGFRYDLSMKGYINDKLVSEDNFKNMTWSFAKIIERASYGVDLFPGDIIGSGTCATGCLLEHNLAHGQNNWLKEGDQIKLEVDGLGVLSNTISLRK